MDAVGFPRPGPVEVSEDHETIEEALLLLRQQYNDEIENDPNRDDIVKHGEEFFHHCKLVGPFVGWPQYSCTVRLTQAHVPDETGGATATGRRMRTTYVVEPGVAYPTTTTTTGTGTGTDTDALDQDIKTEATKMTVGRNGENLKILSSVHGLEGHARGAWTGQVCDASCPPDERNNPLHAEMCAAYAARFGHRPPLVPRHYAPSPDRNVTDSTLVIWHSAHYDAFVLVSWASDEVAGRRRRDAADIVGRAWVKHYDLLVDRRSRRRRRRRHTQSHSHRNDE